MTSHKATGLMVSMIVLGLMASLPQENPVSMGHNITYQEPDRPRYGMDHIFQPPTYNTTAPHELVRNTTAVVDWKGPVFRVKTNSKGLREEPFEMQPKDDVTRIVIIGDGTVFGYGVNSSERFTEKLEDRLNRDAVGYYQVINAGIPSYGMRDYYHFWKQKAIKYEPDIVMVSFEIEDAIPQRAKKQVHKEVQNEMNITGSNMEAVHSQQYDRLIAEHMRSLYENITVPESDIADYGIQMHQIGERQEVPVLFFLTTPASETRKQSVLKLSNRTGMRIVMPPAEFDNQLQGYVISSGGLYLNGKGHTVTSEHIYEALKRRGRVKEPFLDRLLGISE